MIEKFSVSYEPPLNTMLSELLPKGARRARLFVSAISLFLIISEEEILRLLNRDGEYSDTSLDKSFFSAYGYEGDEDHYWELFTAFNDSSRADSKIVIDSAKNKVLVDVIFFQGTEEQPVYHLSVTFNLNTGKYDKIQVFELPPVQ